MLLLSSANFFKIKIFKKSISGIPLRSIIVYTDLDGDQGRSSVDPGLGPNCLQILSLLADDKHHR